MKSQVSNKVITVRPESVVSTFNDHLLLPNNNNY